MRTVIENSLMLDDGGTGLIAKLPKTKYLIDIGCGIRPAQQFLCEEHICIEPHFEYVDILNTWKPSDRKATIVQAEVEALAHFPREDTRVILLDVIEHLEKPRGEAIRNLMMEFQHAAVFTPQGWYEQGGGNPDGWGLNGGEWQRHRSAWDVGDFPGWNIAMVYTAEAPTSIFAYR